MGCPSEDGANVPGGLPEACMAACRAGGPVGSECDRHATGMDHCRVCAGACRCCEQTRRELLEKIA